MVKRGRHSLNVLCVIRSGRIGIQVVVHAQDVKPTCIGVGKDSLIIEYAVENVFCGVL